MLSGMRHVWTVIAAAVIAPIAWLLLAYGQDRSLQAFANEQGSGGLDSGDFLRPVLCLAGAGLLFGLIATLRFSPLGAVLTGAVYTASYLALLVNPDALVDLFPHKVSLAGRVADPTTPLRTGASLLLGALLLVGVVSIGRWRRWPSSADAEPDWSEPGTAWPDDRPLGAEGLGLMRNERTRSRGSRWTPAATSSASSWPTTGWG
jgi:hypothetical protein